jgi:hypothetical protein
VASCEIPTKRPICRAVAALPRVSGGYFVNPIGEAVSQIGMKPKECKTHDLIECSKTEQDVSQSPVEKWAIIDGFIWGIR